MGDDHVTAAMAPQPTSRISSLMPKFCTMAWAAGPRLLFIMLMTRLIPAKPMPMVRPLLNAFDNFTRKISPMMVMMIGSMTTAPASRIVLKIL